MYAQQLSFGRSRTELYGAESGHQVYQVDTFRIFLFDTLDSNLCSSPTLSTMTTVGAPAVLSEHSTRVLMDIASEVASVTKQWLDLVSTYCAAIMASDGAGRAPNGKCSRKFVIAP